MRIPKKFKFIKNKFAITSFSFLVVIFLSMFSYYHLDPSLLTTLAFYQNLANPSVRIVRVPEGLRKEEIAEIVAEKLSWDEEEKEEFVNTHLALNSSTEGKYFPKTYMIHKDQGPAGVTSKMILQFKEESSKIKKPKGTRIVNPDTAVIIASIIQREAAGKEDMKLISGIIWNRLFSGMKLQIDATLQYAKGSEIDGWWNRVKPVDKKIDSPYNTYLIPGLPPGAISNPGLSALDAAYNPQKTSCLYYLHDKKRKIHCAKTYEEHRKNIERYY